MKFTRLHWILSLIVTLFASLVFLVIAWQSEAHMLFYGFSGVCFLYALVALYQSIKVQPLHKYHEIADEHLYKSACPNCGEPLAGHELTCPNCGTYVKADPVREVIEESKNNHV